MSLSAAQFDTDHRALVDDWPDTVTVSGVGYPCNRVSLRSSELQRLRAEFATDYRMTLTVTASRFTTAPAQGDTLTYGGVSYRVLDTEDSPDAVDLRLHLGKLYQGGG